MVLSRGRKIRREKNGCGNSDKTRLEQIPLTQQRRLKGELEIDQGTEGSWEGQLEMLNGLQEWIGLRTFRGLLPSTQQAAHGIQSLAQTLEQMITGFQGQTGHTACAAFLTEAFSSN